MNMKKITFTLATGLLASASAFADVKPNGSIVPTLCGTLNTRRATERSVEVCLAAVVNSGLQVIQITNSATGTMKYAAATQTPVPAASIYQVTQYEGLMVPGPQNFNSGRLSTVADIYKLTIQEDLTGPNREQAPVGELEINGKNFGRFEMYRVYTTMGL
jgi:hypothetical protein